MGEEKRNAARKENDKLVKANFIKKAHYSTWLTNVVMVKKPNGKWWMCTATLTSTRLVQKMFILYPVSTDQ